MLGYPAGGRTHLAPPLLKSLQPGSELHKRAVAAATRGLDRYAQAVLTNARQRAPIEFGDLRRSATALPTDNNQGRLTKEIGFGMSYAAAVHERLDLHHPEGEAKYLENALREMQYEFEGYIRQEIRQAL